MAVIVNGKNVLQGLMFGYATDETEECMPLTIILAHKLNAKMAELRRNGTLPWLRPDSKTQVKKNKHVHIPCRYILVEHTLTESFTLAGDSPVYAGPWSSDPNSSAHHCSLCSA